MYLDIFWCKINYAAMSDKITKRSNYYEALTVLCCYTLVTDSTKYYIPFLASSARKYAD